MQESGLTKIIPFMCISAILSVLLSVYNYDIQKSGGTSLQHHPPTFYCHVQTHECSKNTGVGNLSLLQVLFPTQGLNRSLASWEDSLLAEPQGQKTRDLKLRNLVLFYIWEDARVWAYQTHSFHVHLSYPGPVSCAFHILSSPGAHRGEWLQSWGLLDGRYSQPSSGAHPGGLQSLMTVTSLFTDTAGNIPILSPSHWSGIWSTCGRHFMTIVPQCWEAPPRLGQSSHWYATPGVNFQSSLIDRL